MFQTPVLFLIYNRPETASRVFEKIRQIQPRYLYVAADGPRHDCWSDQEKCRQARNAIMGRIDWACELKTLFRNRHLGCGQAVSSALTWFFENVREGIVLEDDCFPHESFFSYCQVLLCRYRSCPEVMHISGHNLLYETNNCVAEDIFFSKMCHIWGWASWRRAWAAYDFRIFERDVVFSLIGENVKNRRLRNYYEDIVLQFRAGHIDTWDFQWLFSIWQARGLSIVPRENRIVNIGFDSDATHTSPPARHQYINYGNVHYGSNFSLESFPERVSVHREANIVTFF